MDPAFASLQLFLEELDIPPKISTLDDRKRVQKAVYLGQLTGVDLGYRFSWYLMGPYSPALTQDYYALQTELTYSAWSEEQHSQHQLKDELAANLRTLKPYLTPSQECESDITQEQWLELMASVDYLRRVGNRDRVAIDRIMREQKPHLSSFVDLAIDTLDEAERAGVIKAS